MKLSKNFKNLILILAIGVSFSSSVFAEDGLIAEEMNNLTELGFTKEEIESMPDEKLEQYKKFDSISCESDEKYYKLSYKVEPSARGIYKEGESPIVEMTMVSKEEALEAVKKAEIAEENSINPKYIIDKDKIQPNGWLRLETFVYTGDNHEEYAIKTEFEWLKEPFSKMQDSILTKVCEDLVMVEGSEMAYIYRDYYGREHGEYAGDHDDIMNYATDIDPSGHGCSFTFDVGKGFLGCKCEPYGKMMFMAETKRNGVNAFTTTGLYGHAKVGGTWGINWGAPTYNPSVVMDNSERTYIKWNN